MNASQKFNFLRNMRQGIFENILRNSVMITIVPTGLFVFDWAVEN